MTKRDNNTVIFDANIWIASMYSKDIFHYEAIRMISRYLKMGFKILIPSIILLEIINVLSRKGLVNREIDKKLENLKTIKSIEFVDLDIHKMKELCLLLVDQIRLRSQDLYILLFVLKYSPKHFETFDVELKESYNQAIKE